MIRTPTLQENRKPADIFGGAASGRAVGNPPTACRARHRAMVAACRGACAGSASHSQGK